MSGSPELGPNRPTPAIALAGGADAATSRFTESRVDVGDTTIERLRGACADVSVDAATLAESSRDWWPLAMTWALDGQVGALASVVCRPNSIDEVAAIAMICNDERIPLTTAAGRSGVSGASVPVHGGVVLDTCAITGITDVDDTSLVATVNCGMFGDHFEDQLRRHHGLTAGHWPQSMTLATVGGWIACRGAGQLSTRYGKIEDIVTGLTVVLADGTIVTTGGHPRQAVGPDLTQIFVGSEGTLGILCSAQLRLHPVPPHEQRAAYGFADMAAALDACRRILRRGATPAVLRLYDAVESDRHYGTGDTTCVVIALDEGDEAIVAGTFAVIESECARALRLDDALVEHWLGKRNDVSQLEALIAGGLVVDTMEISAPWSRLAGIYEAAVAALSAVPGHQSHAYPDGACLYFTFAGQPGEMGKDAYYRAVWDAGTHAVLEHGGSLSHHHGIGANRSRFVAEALGSGFGVFQAMKDALDPVGILNPGKLGLSDPFGDVALL